MSGGFGSNTLASPQRKMQVLSMKKRGLGTPTLSGSCANMCTMTDNGVGDYTITLKSGYVFTQIPEVLLTPVTAAATLRASSISISAIRVLGFNQADGTTAKETDYDILIIGSLARDLIG